MNRKFLSLALLAVTATGISLTAAGPASADETVSASSASDCVPVHLAGPTGFDQGLAPSTAISGSTVIEVHQGSVVYANGVWTHELWYRTGTWDSKAVKWGPSTKYAVGDHPRIAMSGTQIVEVHEGASVPGTKTPTFDLWATTGYIANGAIRFSTSKRYDAGSRPAVAMTGNHVIEVHQGALRTAGGVTAHDLWYRIGGLSTGKLTLAASHPYDRGDNPNIAVGSGGLIEVHEGAAVAGKVGIKQLWYRTRLSSGKAVRYDSGAKPTIAVVEGRFVEAHQGSPTVMNHQLTTELWRRYGTFDADGAKFSKGYYYSNGTSPSLAFDQQHIVDVHEGATGADGNAVLWSQPGTYGQCID